MSFKNIKFGTLEEFNVLLEIPLGSPIKYEYDPERDEIVEEFVFKDGFKYAYNYGFIFGTKAGDGDNLDVIILEDQPLALGSVIPCRAIGMMKLIDRGAVDNKIIAVRVTHTSKEIGLQSINDLPKAFFDDMTKFFDQIAIQKNKDQHVVGFVDKEQALEEIQSSLLSIENRN